MPTNSERVSIDPDLVGRQVKATEADYLVRTLIPTHIRLLLDDPKRINILSRELRATYIAILKLYKTSLEKKLYTFGNVPVNGSELQTEIDNCNMLLTLLTSKQN